MFLLAFSVCFIHIHAVPIDTVMVDMTYTYEDNMPYYPMLKPFEMKVVINGSTEEYNWYQTEQMATKTHMGTHMDAPAHFSRGGLTIDEIPLNKLIAPAAVINIANKAKKDHDAVVAIEDLLNWESQTGKSLNNTIVLVNSGWGKKWHNRAEYLGTEEIAREKLHFPGISREAAQWLVDNRDVTGVGVDTVSIDKGSSRDFPAHNIILGKGLYALENVANLERIPVYGAVLHVTPMKIGRASGAPTRIIAIFPKVIIDQENQDYCNLD